MTVSPDTADALALPPEWGARGVALRRKTPDDEPFLAGLFASVRLPELEVTGWPEDAKRYFLATQFLFQSRHYANAYANGDCTIVTRDDRPIGRLYLDWGPADVRVVDISLLPAARGTGLGAALLRVVQATAAARGRTVSLHVDLINPAQRLYQRLGFVVTGQNGPSWQMVWTALSGP